MRAADIRADAISAGWSDPRVTVTVPTAPPGSFWTGWSFVPHRSLRAATASGPACADIATGVGSVFLMTPAHRTAAVVTGVAPGGGPMPWCNVATSILIGDDDADERVVAEQIAAYAGGPLGQSAVRASGVLAQRATVPIRRVAAVAMLSAMARATFTEAVAAAVHRPSTMDAITATVRAPPRPQWTATVARLLLEVVERTPQLATPATARALDALNRRFTRRSALPPATRARVAAALTACRRFLQPS